MKTKLTSQEMLAEIRKLAVTPPPAPGAAPAAPTTRSNVPTSNIGRPVSNTSSITKMQAALQSLAQMASSAQTFDSFLTKHYLRNDTVSNSVEFGPKPQVNVPEQTDSSKLSWVMDNMHKVATMKDFADGSWGKMTNDSLINALALAEGLFNVAKEFKLPIHSYNEAALNKVRQAIQSSNNLTPQQKAEDAEPLTEHLTAIKRLYNEVKQELLLNHSYRAYVENKKPYVQYKQQSQELSPDQIIAIEQVYPNGFAIKSDASNVADNVQVNDLQNIGSIQKWVAEHPKSKANAFSVIIQALQQADQGVF